MKFGIFLCSVFIFCSSCSKELEPEPCSVSSFLGTWKVKEDPYSTNCALDGTTVFTIVKGDWPNQIKMKFDHRDTLVFQVWDCTARKGDSSVGAVSSIQMKYENDKISLTKIDIVLLLPLYCNMTLIRE
jgi:hypothetical protein